MNVHVTARSILRPILLLIFSCFLTAGVSHAQSPNPYCIPGLGGQVFSAGKPLEIKILYPPSNPIYTDDLIVNHPNLQGPVATNREIGKIIRLDRQGEGVELLFSMFVRDTGLTYKIGPGTRNHDRIPHAVVECLDNYEAIIGFEDIQKGGDAVYADSDYSYNDLLFHLRIVPGPGDVNIDGDVNVEDAVVTLRSIASGIRLSVRAALLADLNRDRAVEVDDVVSILRISVGLDAPPADDPNGGEYAE